MSQKTIDRTKEVLISMLTENTGRHICDSGGAYGRHWERNQGRKFEDEEESTLEFHTWKSADGKKGTDIDVTHNIFHWLSSRLEFNSQLDEQFKEFIERYESKDISDEDEQTAIEMEMSWHDYEGRYEFQGWLAAMRCFIEKGLRDGDGEPMKAAGIYGEGEPIVENSYNSEDFLSQTIQFLYWEDENGAHVLLQIHGGCDVRGGYTMPRAFNTTDECGIFDFGRATIACSDCEANWTNDGGYGWDYDGGSGPNKLQTFPVFELDEDEPIPTFNIRCEKCGKFMAARQYEELTGSCPDCGAEYEMPDRPVTEPEEGTIVVIDKTAHCPMCGKGELHSSFY